MKTPKEYTKNLKNHIITEAMIVTMFVFCK